MRTIEGQDGRNHEGMIEEEVSSPAQKLSYSAPVLRVYGKVKNLTMGPSPGTTEGAGSKFTRPSDRSVKCDIVEIGRHPIGIGLYLFSYRPEYVGEWGSGLQCGVMADEVERIMPEAVCVHRDGFKMVAYDMLNGSRATQGACESGR